jgi:hypothetical protein
LAGRCYGWSHAGLRFTRCLQQRAQANKPIHSKLLSMSLRRI